jgi:hypothetical protein
MACSAPSLRTRGGWLFGWLMKPSMPTIAKGNFVSCAPLSKKCVEWRLPRSKAGGHAVRYNTTASVVDASARKPWRKPWRILMAFLPTPSGQDYAVASPHATTDQQLQRMDVHGPCQRGTGFRLPLIEGFLDRFIKRGHPAAKHLAEVLDLVHVVVRELVVNLMRFLFTHSVLGLKILYHSFFPEVSQRRFRHGFFAFADTLR